MHHIELVSNLLCPYTQRAAIQLAEKGLPFERTYIDLAAKPGWFDDTTRKDRHKYRYEMRGVIQRAEARLRRKV